jgi:serine phosphatase RsbU (regulator of sigma subunit)
MEKKHFNSRYLWIFGLLILIFVSNLIESVRGAIRSGNGLVILGPLLTLLVVALIAYRSRGKVQQIREEYRRRFEKNKDHAGIRDAAIFSLSWSREIYREIPEDRKGLVKQAFILIGLGMIIVLFQTGISGIIPLLLIAAVVLAGVNLLVWVVATESGEKSRLKIELETARQMQLSLMPPADPKIPGFDISGVCIPAHDVGGDNFDYVWLGEGQRKFAVALMDVSGKGMDAALTAVYTSGAFGSEVQHQSSVSRMLRNLNSAIRSRQNRKRFVSFFMISLDLASHETEYINAGQCRPLLLRNNQITQLDSTDPRFPLGVMDGVEYESHAFRFQPGDKLLLYTDGVPDAMDSEQNEFGEERLRGAFVQAEEKNDSARSVIERIQKEILLFSAPAEQHDDLTIVVIHVLPSGTNR